MNYILKFNESKSLLSENDKEIISIVDIIEDTLVDFKLSTELSLNRDQAEYEKYFTSSVQIDIISKDLSGSNISQWTGKVGLSIGNPYSADDINIDKLNKLIFEANRKVEFLNAIKSLHYRLEKSGYIINFFNYEQSKVSFCFVVEDEKILKKNER